MINAGKDLIGHDLYAKVSNRRQSNFDSFERAVDLIIFLLSNESKSVNGRLISAEWDDWETIDYRTAIELDPSIYTIRRKDKQC
jgi:hypothetical protein